MLLHNKAETNSVLFVVHWQSPKQTYLLYPGIFCLNGKGFVQLSHLKAFYRHTWYATEADRNRSGTYLQQSGFYIRPFQTHSEALFHCTRLSPVLIHPRAHRHPLLFLRTQPELLFLYRSPSPVYIFQTRHSIFLHVAVIRKPAWLLPSRQFSWRQYL